MAKKYTNKNSRVKRRYASLHIFHRNPVTCKLDDASRLLSLLLLFVFFLVLPSLLIIFMISPVTIYSLAVIG